MAYRDPYTSNYDGGRQPAAYTSEPEYNPYSTQQHQYPTYEQPVYNESYGAGYHDQPQPAGTGLNNDTAEKQRSADQTSGFDREAFAPAPVLKEK
jgi:hypothetical protein